MGWGVSVTPRPLFTPGKEPVPIIQKARWAPGPVWTGEKNLAPTGIRSPDRPARSSVAIPTELRRTTEHFYEVAKKKTLPFHILCESFSLRREAPKILPKFFRLFDRQTNQYFISPRMCFNYTLGRRFLLAPTVQVATDRRFTIWLTTRVPIYPGVIIHFSGWYQEKSKELDAKGTNSSISFQNCRFALSGQINSNGIPPERIKVKVTLELAKKAQRSRDIALLFL